MWINANGERGFHCRDPPRCFSPDFIIRGSSGTYSFAPRHSIGNIYTPRTKYPCSSSTPILKPTNTRPRHKLHPKIALPLEFAERDALSGACFLKRAFCAPVGFAEGALSVAPCHFLPRIDGTHAGLALLYFENFRNGFSLPSPFFLFSR